jgi:hypothetical protein
MSPFPRIYHLREYEEVVGILHSLEPALDGGIIAKLERFRYYSH